MDIKKLCFKVDKINSDTLIVSFAGHDKKYGEIQKFEFLNFLEKHFPNVSRHFYVDKFLKSYHTGFYGITNNIDETVIYLQNEIKNYTNVLFLGVSSGGYAAILFGSLLNITSVLAFIPQTFLRAKNVNEKYRDIKPFINDTTKYYIFGDKSILDVNSYHHIFHCERISYHKNVYFFIKNNFNLTKMRDNGELYKIINNIICKLN